MKKNDLIPGKLQALLLALLTLLYACRSDEYFDDNTTEEPDIPIEPSPEVKGFYLLNEGNMFQNKTALDYMDYTTGTYYKEVFKKANPEAVGGLGDVGNAIGVYGSKLYVVVNASNKVEVLDFRTRKRIKQINADNCRYITFYKGKAYLSTYLGAIGDPDGPNGMVAEIDTTRLEITRTVEVGRQPEELVAYNDKIYVANSGGYSPPDYESTVSVIDLNSFKEEKRIEVAINLHRLKIDEEGDIYVSSRGDYYDIPSKLFVIDTKTDAVKKSFELPVSNMTIFNGIAYIYSTEFSYKTGKNTISYNRVDIKTETILDDSFITDGSENLIETPYGIAINPETHEILITDAKDYVTPGTLYCYTPEGVMKWSVKTGDIPGHIAFIN